MGTTVEDEFHVFFECPVYHHIRLKYENALFTDFGGVSRVSRLIETPGKVSAIMEKEPQKVAQLALFGSVWSINNLRHQTYYPILLGRKLSS
jgi:hypothetical protein